jgi:hypothetical protein
MESGRWGWLRGREFGVGLAFIYSGSLVWRELSECYFVAKLTKSLWSTSSRRLTSWYLDSRAMLSTQFISILDSDIYLTILYIQNNIARLLF